MVNKIISFLIATILVSVVLTAATSDIYITSAIDEYSAVENQPLKGTITVTHDLSDKVDTSSFLLDKKPLKVEFTQDVKISSSSPIVISYYSFEIPPQPPGLYVLPEVSVKIEGNSYRSVMSSYQVKAAGESRTSPPSQPPPTQPAQPSPPANAPITPSTPKPTPVTPILRLEASVEGNKPIYPGQKAKFVYRFFFNTSIDLTKEVLPLLDAEGFIKDGDKESKDYTQNNLTVSEVSQAVIAGKPGDYPFGPSTIEGYDYSKDSKGKPVYTSSKLTAEAPAMTVTVAPFPNKGKPVSFNGAVGDFQLKTSILSPSDLTVGDEITLSIDISGKGDLNAVKLPDIFSQPGFSGFFRMSDLPPVGTIKGDVKNYVVHMRPLTEAVKEIPSIELSFLDPTTSSYQAVHSKPIPITVKETQSVPVKSLDQQQKAPAIPEKGYHPSPIEIQSIFTLSSKDLYNLILGTWWALGIIPFGIALLIYQRTVRDFLEKMQKEVKVKSSNDLLKEALQQPKGSSKYFELLNNALKLRLVENGLTPAADIPNDKIPKEGLPGEVRSFLNEIDENRFAGEKEIAFNDLESKANALFERLSAVNSKVNTQQKGVQHHDSGYSP